MEVLSYWTNFDTGWGWMGGERPDIASNFQLLLSRTNLRVQLFGKYVFFQVFQSVLKLSVDKLCFLSDESCVCEYKYQFSPFPLLCTVVKQMPPRCWRSCSVVLPL